MGQEEANDQPTQLEKKIIKQMEYYFGDKNLPRDKFLQDKVHQEDGWVPLDCLITFNRLKILSTDFGEILKALGKSQTGLLELDNENNKVRRKPDKAVPSSLDPEVNRLSKLKTLYVKGFPTDYTLDKIEEFFEGKWDVIFIKMRRFSPDAFKGSIFVEFSTQEVAKDFLKQELRIGDNVLEKMTKDDYYKKKDEEKKMEKNRNKANAEEKEEQEEKEKFVTGCVLHFDGAGEGTSREDLKSLFGEKHEISWVDFNRNDTEGFIRFKGEGIAQKVVDLLKEANDGKVMIKGVEAVIRILEGEEEKEFWKKSEKDREMIRQKRFVKGKRGRGQKRPFHETRSRMKNGDQKKQEPKGEHKRFNDDDGDAEVKEEKVSKPDEDLEPRAKQVKAE